MSGEIVQSLFALAIGFAAAGLTASTYQLCAERPLSFRLMGRPERSAALASVPLLVLAAPFLIMRNTLRGRAIEGRHAGFVAIATVIAGLWSLMSGTALASGFATLVATLG